MSYSNPIFSYDPSKPSIWCAWAVCFITVLLIYNSTIIGRKNESPNLSRKHRTQLNQVYHDWTWQKSSPLSFNLRALERQRRCGRKGWHSLTGRQPDRWKGKKVEGGKARRQKAKRRKRHANLSPTFQGLPNTLQREENVSCLSAFGHPFILSAHPRNTQLCISQFANIAIPFPLKSRYPRDQLETSDEEPINRDLS